MLTFFFVLSLFVRILFIYSRTPLSLALFVISQTLRVSILIYAAWGVSWFSFILIIVFLRGVIVVFSYVASLARNTYFQIQVRFYTSMRVIVRFLLLVWIFYTRGLNLSANSLDSAFNCLYKMYTDKVSFITSAIIIYLLVVLIVVVKNSSLRKAPLR